MALWGGRFTQGPDQRFKDYNDSLKFDYRMAIEDIEGSICWADAIYKAGVLTAKENADLKKALSELLEEVSKDYVDNNGDTSLTNIVPKLQANGYNIQELELEGSSVADICLVFFSQ